MAKIDVSKIEGFDAMTPEDKLAALMAYEFETPSSDNSEIDRYKAAVSKANAEAASYKQQLREKQTEAERAEADRAEADRKLREELETLKSERVISGYTAKYLAMGYTEDLAKATAEALQKGDMDTVFANQDTFNKEQAKKQGVEALNNQPNLTAGKPPAGEATEDPSVAAFRRAAFGTR
jgi:hypothetical protein